MGVVDAANMVTNIFTQKFHHALGKRKWGVPFVIQDVKAMASCCIVGSLFMVVRENFGKCDGVHFFLRVLLHTVVAVA